MNPMRNEAFDAVAPLRHPLAAQDVSLEAAPTAASNDPVLHAAPPPIGLWSRLLREQSLQWFALLAAAEFALLLASPWLAVQTRFLFEPDMRELAAHTLPLRAGTFATVVWLTMIALGLYQRHRRDDDRAETAIRIGLALCVGAGALMMLYFVLPQTRVGRGILALSLAYALLLLPLSRLVFAKLLFDARFHRRTLFLGAGEQVAGTLQRIRDEQATHTTISAGFVPLPGDRIAVADADLVRPAGTLLDHVRRYAIDEIVIAADDRRGALPMDELLVCRLSGVQVLPLASFYERELGKVSLERSSPSWFVFSGAGSGSLLRRFVKRSFDVSAATGLLLVTWPLMVLTALAILIESRGRGPVLYRQERVGKHDRTFELLKFRSMRTDAEANGVAVWAQTGDARVTRVGRFIRKYRLDELPQLWNVLRGEMSIVGPRPERPQFVDQFRERIPYYALRHCVKPGLTGWAQLRFPYGASEADTIEKLRYDLYYVKNHGFQFDLAVLLQTVEVVLFGRGGR